ncbi:MAG: aromatic ring-hydroxylating dioxygenase subunit alpha [Candidatus Melainabacteria bacterium HGW-Melainabacteria-1]|nr:MAG: aromatic ring-hydroxylating dioxygenase subunit alpha [Candidatus Melainabacteria bacterium HGW-Melainabacteria-1]
MSFRHYWYVVCRSSELKADKPLGRELLGEWIVLFRDQSGSPVAFQDRCPHRNYRLSHGTVRDGRLQCPYHGWTYDESAEVVAIPCEGESFRRLAARRAIAYEVMERDDFVYVRLERHPEIDLDPFPMPHYREKGYRTVRLFNVFHNNVTNCAENYVDVPHTVFVHPGIFRVERKQHIQATVTRSDGSVIVDFNNETDNMGWFSWFLNPKGEPIQHRDAFHTPNVTSVDYHFGPHKSFHITSHCTPVNDGLTWVYTDLTYRFGIFNRLAAPIVRYQGQSVIDQDIVALDVQMQVIKKYGQDFRHSRTDVVHILIESLREAIEQGEDPRALPPKQHDFEFWI